LGITSSRLHELKLIDAIIEEPLGGAHRDIDLMADTLKRALLQQLDTLTSATPEQLLKARYKRLMGYGHFSVN